MVGNQSSQQDRAEVPEVVVTRLPQYVRVLNRLLEEGIGVVSSQQLGAKLQVTPAQIRKDLSYFGRFGKQGRGYSVRHLHDRLRDILGLNSYWNVAVVGVGRLGRAILSYPGFTPDGFHLVAAFDASKDVVGLQVGDLTVRSIDELEEVVSGQNISIAIVAVPVSFTQEVTRSDRHISRVRRSGHPQLRTHISSSPRWGQDTQYRPGHCLAIHDLLSERLSRPIDSVHGISFPSPKTANG